MAPLLSVAVPVYDVEAYLVDCLDSIFRQVAEGIEVIAVNDASPDRCGRILEEYAQRETRLRVVHLPTNVGLGQARNAALDHASGEYVWFVDSDDWLPAGAVPAVLARIATHRPDVLVVNHAEVHEDGSSAPGRLPGIEPGGGWPVRLEQCPQLLRSAQSACTRVVRRAFLDDIKLRFAPGWYEDSSFSHRLLMSAGHIEVLDRISYHYRRRRVDSITGTVSARHFEVFQQYERLFDWASAGPPGSEAFLPELFRVMIDHYLVIIGNKRRVPPRMRRAFFRRMAADYRYRLPPGGYDMPGGVLGLKHRLVRHDAYRTYAVLRRTYRVLRAGLSAPRALGRSTLATHAAPAPATASVADRTPGRSARTG